MSPLTTTWPNLRRVFCEYHLHSAGHIYKFDDCMVPPCPSARLLLAAHTPSPDVQERARRLALQLKHDADDMFAMPVDDEPLVTQWADIIAAEFGGGEGEGGQHD